MVSLQRFTFSILSCLCLFVAVQSRGNAQTLQATVSVDLSKTPVWNYTITNLEPPVSGNWVTGFFMPIAAPVINVLSPNGWTLDTDFVTFILWQNLEPAPYPHDIPPGGSLSGFQFESSAPAQLMDYQVGSWDHMNDQPGPEVSGQIVAPGTSPAGPVIPEPGTLYLLAGTAVPAMGFAFRCLRRRFWGSP